MCYSKILNILKNNNIAIVPTDTIYGLCCNALSEEATRELFYIKQRPFTQTIAIAVKDKNEIYKYTKNNSDDMESVCLFPLFLYISFRSST